MKNKRMNKKITINSITVFCTAALMALICMLPFLLKDHMYFVYFGDYNMQQLPFYTLVHRAIRNGELFINMCTDLGSSIYTSYSFYLLGSPFFWLTIPFPEAALPYILPFIIVLKIALAALFAYRFACRYTDDTRAAFICGLLYAFSGFQIMNIVFNHFLDITVFFPLWLILAERLAEEKKRGPFAFCTALIAITNYYFFVGEMVFLLIYIITKYMICGKNLPAFSHIKVRICAIANVTFEAVTGIAVACFFILPSFIAVAKNPRVSDTISIKGLILYDDWKTYAALIKNLFLPPDLIQNYTIFGTDEGALASISLFLPLFAVSGVIAFIIHSRNPGSHRQNKNKFIKYLIIICMIFALIPVLNSSFSAFNRTYYTRWFYMPLLIMSLASALAMKHFEKKPFFIGTAICISGYAILLIMNLISGNLTESLNNALCISNRGLYKSELLCGGICLVFLIYIVFILEKKKSSYMTITLIATAICCMLVMYTHIRQGYNIVSGQGRNFYKEQTAKVPADIENDSTDDFYRIETADSIVNYSMYWNVPSVSSFISTVSGSIMNFYDFAEIERTVSSKLPDNRDGIRSLLSVRYYIDDTGTCSSANNNALKQGTVFTHWMHKSEYNKLSEENRDLVLVYALVPENPDELIKQCGKYNITLTELSADDFCDIINKYGDNTSEYLSDRCSELNKTAATSFKYTDTEFNLKFNNSQEGLMLLSVPYSSGYKAYTDSVKNDILTVDGGLMAICIPSGSKSITFNYKEPGLTAGLCISIVGILILAAYLITDSIIRKRRHI